MAKTSSRHAHITEALVKALEPGEMVWSTKKSGFGVRKQRRDAVFIYWCRHKRQLHRYSLGRHDPATFGVKRAEDEADRIRSEIVGGKSPDEIRRQRHGVPTLREFADRYVAEVGRTKKKARTLAEDERRLKLHILPAMADVRVTDIDRGAVARLHNKMRAKPVSANRTLALLSTILNYAVLVGERPDGPNPCRTVAKFPEAKRERFLTGDELVRLGAAIAEAETAGIPWQPDPKKKAKHAPKPENRSPAKVDEYTAGALRLLLFTGARLREILHLKWANVDFERGIAFLDDSKTGKKTLVLNAPALTVLEALRRVGPYVFPSGPVRASASKGQKAQRQEAKPRDNLKHAWRSIRRRAGLAEVRIHDLRHTFASVGAGAGLGLPIIGKMLGHSQASTTMRYAHLEADPVRRASETISNQIAARLEGRPASKVVPIGAKHS